MAAIIIAALIVFVAGAVAGVIAVVSAGIRREERDFMLTAEAPDRMSQGTRMLTGLYVRDVDLDAGAVAERQTTLV
jgi:hypothetical protein